MSITTRVQARARETHSPRHCSPWWQASFVIFPLPDLGPGLTIMMYADDLIIFLDGRANPQLLRRVWEVVSCFGQFSGLKVNLSKTAAIVRNCGGMEWARCFRDIGVDVKNFVKYLGVRFGNIRHQQDDQGWGLTIEQAFAPALQEAFRRARVVSTLQLSMDERAFMLTSWILPVVAWVSKAYYAPISVVRQLKLVYHVTMGTNSWGITLPILSRPRTHGGLALPEPELFLMHQAAAPFVNLLGEPHKYPDKAVETFYAWATTIGFTPSKDNLPYIQLGMVRTAELKLSWHRETESRPKRPRQAGPGVLQGVQDLIAELVAKGYRIVYTDGSSKRLSHKDMRRAGGFGVFAAEDEQGPVVRFCGYVPTRHGQTNNGAELWAALEALQGFWVPKLAILTDSQYLQLGANGRAQHWKSKGWTTTSGKLQVHVPVWEMLLQEMATPGREVRWEHVPAHVNVQGNEVANGLAMEGMCSSPLWSQHVAPHSSSGSESTVGLKGGSGSDSEDTKAL